MESAIVARNLSKQFLRYHADRPMTLQEAVLRGLRRIGPAERFWALRDVSFSVAPGRMVGLIGRNGAGKSTLLRLIGGVGRPDRGSVEVQGRLGGLLELGAGFHPDLTGRENVFINGVIAGLTRREVAERFDEIVEFAELGAFINSPLRTYSSGMQMRLAFAVAAHTDPEILLIDEVLAVGDLSFQQKCLQRITQFRADGCTIILVSHDATLVRQLCDEVLWLRDGRLVAHGPADVVVGQYLAEVAAGARRSATMQPALHTHSGAELRINENRFGSLELEITAVRLLGSSGLPVSPIESGDPLRVEIDYFVPQPIPSPIFTVTVSREDGLICCDTSSSVVTMSEIQGHGQVALQIERLDLNGGQYYVDVGAYEQNWAYTYDYHWHVYPLIVHPTTNDKGVIYPPHRWEIGGEQVVAEEPALASGVSSPQGGR